MRIQRLDPAGEPADLAAALPAIHEHFAQMQPGFPLPGETTLRFWSSDGYRERSRVYGVFDEEGGPASAVLILSLRDESNLDMAGAYMTLTAARLQDHIGEFLVREAVRLAAAEGRTRLVTTVTDRVDPMPFFDRFSGKNVCTSTRSVLDLSAIDREQYAAWAAGSEKNSGYRLVRWVDHCPDELVESFCVAMDAMQDAPDEDLNFEHLNATVERLRPQEQHTVDCGVRRWVQAAVDAQGRIAGFCMFTTKQDEPEAVDIWDTAVLAEHRGHGLGLRIKAAAALWVLEENPRAHWVQTFNNHGNKHMLDVNTALGYRKSEDWYDVELQTGT